MRIGKIVVFVLIGLVLLAVAAVVALIFVDHSVYRNQLETRASAAFDREFKITGPIHLERSLRPRIIVEDISIGNPAWATGTHFATAEKVGVQVALFPLLRGNLKILDVAFSGVNLLIEEGPGGALWVGTEGGGVNRLERRSGQFLSFRHDRHRATSLSDDTVYSLHVDAEGTLWVGTAASDPMVAEAASPTSASVRSALPQPSRTSLALRNEDRD